MAAKLALPQFAHFTLQTHGVMLVGVSGHASMYEAAELANAITKDKGLIQHVTRADDKTGIAINQIRELYSATRSKSAGIKRVWIIENAETMSLDAQNAFLKLLEEPPADVIFILCVKTATSLLPTIRSRVQLLQCRPISPEPAQLFLKEAGIPSSLIPGFLFLAAGSASELQQLARNEIYRQEQHQLAATAKQLISAPAFDKIIIIQKIAVDREQVLTVLRYSLQMLEKLAPKQAEHKSSLQQLNKFLEAYERINQNGNTKVQLLQAVL